MINTVEQIKYILKSNALGENKTARFFKTMPGHYAQHDQFIGVPVPVIRKIAQQFCRISFSEIEILLKSKINEERLLALIILVDQYKKADQLKKELIYTFYLEHIEHVNNWNLVDTSAHLIIGVHLFGQKRQILLSLAESLQMWERRIAIVATWYFIRKNDLDWTFIIAKILLHDQHDLIHKSVGWMLREAGKKNKQALINFLDAYALIMPRTTLRYAIEKFDEKQRINYLKYKSHRIA